MTANAIAVTWVSYNHDPFEREKDGSFRVQDGVKRPGPTFELLFNTGSAVCGRVKKLYLFARRARQSESGGRRVDPREEDVVRALRDALADRKPDLEVEVLWWETNAPPTDHRELFFFTAKSLGSIRAANPRTELVVNISPGTPAMQTVMLLALQARLAGDRVRAFQGTPPDKRRGPEDVLREVPWNLLAELAATPIQDDPGAEHSPEWTLRTARSSAMRDVAAQIETLGGSPFPVLILGARGTGKTDVARRLRGAYREWALKTPSYDWSFHLNCAEFRGDPNMLRSALFGQVKGAHSTAYKDEPGVLELAGDDCVLLDEIHWIDFQAQGLLLLALQRNGSFRRVGGGKPISARFRLLAATNKPRAELRDQLLPDFLDRISDLVIELPELRDCREDLGDIWQSVVRRACTELLERDGTRAHGQSAGAKAEALVGEFQPHRARIERALVSMRLPGNFRDLERLARRLLVAGLARGRYLSLKEGVVSAELERLRKEERGDAEAGTTRGATLIDELPTRTRCEDYFRVVRDSGTAFPATDAVETWERRIYEAARQVAGSGAKAAALLGLAPRTFNAKMERWLDGGDNSSRRPHRSDLG